MCYDDNARPPLPPIAGGATQGDDLVLTAEDGNRFAAYLATPVGQAHARVLILPDVRGLHYFYKELAERFAEQGVTALALDYFGRTAGLTARDDSFEYMPHVQQMRFDSFQQDVRAALARLGETETVSRPTFTVGFCMGGTLSFMTGTQDLDLAGVIGFYAGMSRDFGSGGTLLDRASQIKYPVLALFGGADAGIPAEQVERFDRELDIAGVEHRVITYRGAPHSFFDRRAADFAEASADAWTQVLDFIAAHNA
jgi:carboxymethylenebutenolidase